KLVEEPRRVPAKKGKEKLVEEPRRVPAKKGVAAKGIVIQEPQSRDALPLSSSSCSSWKSRSVPPPSNLAGPSKIGEWVVSGTLVRDEMAEIPQKGLERKSYSLELIRNLYQAEGEDEMEEDSPQRQVAAISAPVLIQASESESVEQALHEASSEDVGWLRPVIGRWADVVDSDEEDQYVEHGLGEKEVVVVPRDESGEEDWSDEEDEAAADDK
ncbi:hypothetical protein LINPERPRIM_LOCUS33323, partial [Linum perenne]